MLIKLLLPFFVFLLIYILSNNYIEQKYINNRYEDNWRAWNYAFAGLNLAFASYFLGIEIF